MKSELHNKPLVPYGWLRVLLFAAFYFSLLLIAGLLFTYFQKQAPVSTDKKLAAEGMSYLLFIINAAISVAAVWLFRTIIDRKSFESIGFSIDKNGMHAGTGFFLGIFLLCTGTCILYFSKNLQWTGIGFNGNDLFIGLGLMVIVAFYEEIVFRGYILHNLLESLNKWPALIISAVVFALAHAANPGISIVGAVNILLAGLLAGLNYIYTRNLWFGIMLHVTWNFLQGPVLGYEVSGMHLQSLLQHEIQGNELITGGKFGFEGSLIATLLYTFTIAAFWFIYQKKYGSAVPRKSALSPG